jgi:hypothetical protein
MIKSLFEHFSSVRDRWFESAYAYLAFLPAEEEPSLYTSALIFGLLNGFLFGYLIYAFTH